MFTKGDLDQIVESEQKERNNNRQRMSAQHEYRTNQLSLIDFFVKKLG